MPKRKNSGQSTDLNSRSPKTIDEALRILAPPQALLVQSQLNLTAPANPFSIQVSYWDLCGS
nr:hypothetical protein W01H2.1 - Caenorhabditis elegans [Caenorhabditis elegans]